MNNEKNIQTKHEIIAILRTHAVSMSIEYGVKRIGLFGSYATDTATAMSDIDLVVEFEQPMGLKFMEFCDYLEDLLGTKVDVLTPTGIETIRLTHIAERIQESVVYIETQRP